MKYGYLRTGENQTENDNIFYELKNYGCSRIFKEKPEVTKELATFTKLVETLAKGDTVVVYNIEKLKWYQKQLCENFELLKANGIEFVSITDGLDSTREKGKSIFDFIALLAPMERTLIKDRTIKGLVKARLNGKVGGKKKGLTVQAQKIALSVLRLNRSNNRLPSDKRQSVDEMAHSFGISRASFYRYKKFAENKEKANV